MTFPAAPARRLPTFLFLALACLVPPPLQKSLNSINLRKALIYTKNLLAELENQTKGKLTTCLGKIICTSRVEFIKIKSQNIKSELLLFFIKTTLSNTSNYVSCLALHLICCQSLALSLGDYADTNPSIIQILTRFCRKRPSQTVSPLGATEIMRFF